MTATKSSKQQVKPLLKLTSSITKCAPVGKAYGDCILANYQTVSKDICLQEFMRFKECVQKDFGRKW